ncbi:MAG: ABC transporter permease [Planctomycetales bacterium]
MTISSDIRVSSEIPASRWEAVWRFLDNSMAQTSDLLNPILVKETRQALKSRQFLLTFGLVLILCWIWSIGGVALIGPQVYYSSEGAMMFSGYYIILTFCLSLVIPYFTYRSMVNEYEDNTYELLSITTLKPWQIIAGKLGSAVVQMVVYLSAVAPCLAFSYMLKGIDIMAVGWLLTYAVLGCLGLTVISLFLATLTHLRYLQVLISVGLIGGLLMVFGMSWAGTFEFLRFNMVSDSAFLVVNGILLTQFFVSFIQIFLASTARITFLSENRSTPLRWGMLLQHGCIAGWVIALIVIEGPSSAAPYGAVALMVLLGIHWYAMGMMMAGESPTLSERVRRRLPTGIRSRMFLTFFSPGPATGFLFTVANLIAGFVLCLIMMLFDSIYNSNGRWPAVLGFAALMVGYIICYLGLGNLILAFLRRFTSVTILLSILVQIVLVLLFCLGPMVLMVFTTRSMSDDFSLLQTTNAFWTLAEFGDRLRVPDEGPVLLFLVPVAALFFLVVNLRMGTAAIRQTRISQPQRLIDEQAALKAATTRPQSPWDPGSD